MAILSTSNTLSEQRWNSSDQRRIESAVRNDFDSLISSVVTGSYQGYIIRGFSIVTSGAIGSASNGLAMSVDPGAVLNINASVSGTIFQTPFGTPNQTLNAATNTNVSGSFTASSTNYVGIDYNRFADSSTNETKYLWTASSNSEVEVIAPAAQTLTFKIYITTSPWAPNVLPVAIIKTDSNGNVTSITDARFNLYSLETGGLSPNPNYVYPWSAGRTQSPVTITSANSSLNPFVGGDKQISSLKDWMNAIMSEILETKGTPYWFSGTAGGGPLPSLQSLSQDLGNTIVTGKGSISHGVSPVDKTTPTAAGQVNWDQDVNLRVIGSSLTYTLTANPSSTDISLTDDQVCYVTLVRDVVISPNLVFTGSSPVVTSVGAVTWTTGLLPGDFIKVASNTVAGYYKILSVDSGSQVTLTTNVSVGDDSGLVGFQAKYAFGSYQNSPSPSTNRNLFISSRATVPAGANVFWLFVRTDNSGAPRVYVRFMGSELNNGEDREVDGTTSKELLLYIGAASQSVFYPAYVASVSPGSVPEIIHITNGGGGTITGGQYFFINSSGDYRRYCVWFKVDGVGSDPAPALTNDAIEVDILSSDTATQVSTKITTAFNTATFRDFSAVGGAGTVIITNTSAGTTVTASNFNVGAPFAVTETQAGTGTGNFTIHDGDSLTLAIKELDLALGNLEASLDSPSYDEVVEIVTSGATPPTSLNGPVANGTNIILPNNSREGNIPQKYTVGKGSLLVFLNGQFLDLESGAYAEVGVTGAASNQIQILTLPSGGLVVGDELEFRLSGGGGGAGGGGEGPPGPAGPVGPPGENSATGPVAVSVKTGSYSVLTTDCYLSADCTSGPIIFTLPVISGNTGRIFYFKKIDASVNPLMIVGTGGNLIDGSGSFIIGFLNQAVAIIDSGSTWWVF